MGAAVHRPLPQRRITQIPVNLPGLARQQAIAHLTKELAIHKGKYTLIQLDLDNNIFMMLLSNFTLTFLHALAAHTVGCGQSM
jgi:hypothetical protein